MKFNYNITHINLEDCLKLNKRLQKRKEAQKRINNNFFCDMIDKMEASN